MPLTEDLQSRLREEELKAKPEKSQQAEPYLARHQPLSIRTNGSACICEFERELPPRPAGSMPLLCLNSRPQEQKRPDSNSQNWLIFLDLAVWSRSALAPRLPS